MKILTLNVLENLEENIKKRSLPLHSDLLGFDTLNAVHSISELIHKIVDGEFLNAFSSLILTFASFQCLKISPAALFISFYNYKLLESPKLPQTTASELPKISYICFHGFYSQLDIDIINQFSQNVQIIMIYDASTQDSSFSDINADSSLRSEQDEDIRASNYKKKHPKINPNVLLLPLDCGVDTDIDSSVLYNLFERVVFPSITRYNPEAVVISSSFNYHSASPFEASNPRITLDEGTWSRILYQICLISNFRVLVMAHKLIKRKEYYTETDFDTETHNMKRFFDSVETVCCRPWDTSYLENCFVCTLEILSGS